MDGKSVWQIAIDYHDKLLPIPPMPGLDYSEWGLGLTAAGFLAGLFFAMIFDMPKRESGVRWVVAFVTWLALAFFHRYLARRDQALEDWLLPDFLLYGALSLALGLAVGLIVSWLLRLKAKPPSAPPPSATK